MRLNELFDQPTRLGDQMKQSVLDVLMPMVASKVPFVTVQQITDELRKTKPGVLVDRSLIMDLLDPDSVQCVKKIEGDRIYLQQPEHEQREAGADQAEKDQAQVQDTAQKQATKAVTDDTP